MTVHVKTADEATLEHVREAIHALQSAALSLQRAAREQRQSAIAVYLCDLQTQVGDTEAGLDSVIEHLQKEATA